MKKLWKLIPIAPAVLAAACSAGPPPREIAEARLAVQDAKNANADQLATREYDAAIAHLRIADFLRELFHEIRFPRRGHCPIIQ